MSIEEKEYLRKELLNINFEISKIEKNHHLEGEELENAKLKLAELKKHQRDIHDRLKHVIYEEVSMNNRGARR